eukprot:COSAG06_NODE_46494_length_346_cov_1.036437_1_plen_25_part_10
MLSAVAAVVGQPIGAAAATAAKTAT